MTVSYRLVSPTRTSSEPPRLDDRQQAVVDHRGGPLLVLAGPGTGKTTTIVELVAQRVLAGEVLADEVLMLTFSRKAAEELRLRTSARIGPGRGIVAASTFHSFCHGLVAHFAVADGAEEPPLLMTAPERDTVVRELIAGTDPMSWPQNLREALGTRGFADEVQDFMDRMLSRGITTDELARLAIEQDRPVWARLAELIDEYRDVTALRNVIDYSGLIERAISIVSEHHAELSSRYRLIVVDEYQDTDPQQVELLQYLASGGAELVVVGDPDQSIYAFRGADQNGILQFADQFAQPNPVEIISLATTRRFGSEILRASQATLRRLSLPVGRIAEHMREHRNLTSVAADPGRVDIATFVNATAEGEHIAQLLRRAHLEDGVPWQDMAVLVRNADDVARLARILTPAGVPLEVAGDEIPLIMEPAVRQLLDALELAERLAEGVTPSGQLIDSVLAGPLGQLDAAALRRIARLLKQRDPSATSTELIHEAFTEPVLLGVAKTDSVTEAALRQFRDVASLIAAAADDLRSGRAPEQALWRLWDGSGWPARLRREWERGGETRLRAGRDLDAMCALFEHAAKVEEHGRRRSVANLLAELRAQQLPADRLSVDTLSGEAVRLMTAHRAKGLEWPLVVVAGVQEEVWPHMGADATLLRSELLGVDNLHGRGAQLREERRLFFVACTRAKSRLVVTAVDSALDDGETPSRFVTELQAEFFPNTKPKPFGRPARPVSLRGVISRLRAIGEEPDATEAERLAVASLLAELDQSGLFAARAANPDRWWGTSAATESPVPWRDPESMVRLSASMVESIDACPLKWFLAREAKAEGPSSDVQAKGSVVHAIAEDLARRTVDPAAEPPDAEEMKQHLEDVWHRFGIEAQWASERLKADAQMMLDRLHAWHSANPRTLRGAEVNIAGEIELESETVSITGSSDRIETSVDGDEIRIRVVDLKTGGTVPTKAQAEANIQLQFYQLAVARGLVQLDDLDGLPGGGALVYLAKQQGTKPENLLVPTERHQSPLLDEATILEKMNKAVQTIRTEELVARPSDRECGYCPFKAVCPTATTWVVAGGDQ